MRFQLGRWRPRAVALTVWIMMAMTQSPATNALTERPDFENFAEMARVDGAPTSNGHVIDRQHRREVDDDDDGKNSTSMDPVVRWLWKLKVDLPDESFRESFITVHVKNMVCTNFAIDSIDSKYSSGEISLAVDGLSASCRGQYAAIGASGDVSVTVGTSDDGPLQLAAAVGSKMAFIRPLQGKANEILHFPIASNVTLTQCLSTLAVKSIKFSGSASARIVDLFSDSIAKSVSTALGTELCPLVKDGLESNVDSLIATCNDHVLAWIQNYSLPQDKDEDQIAQLDAMFTSFLATQENTISWIDDIPFLHTVLHQANRVASAFLDEGIAVKVLKRLGFHNAEACEDGDCGFFFEGINGVIRQLTGLGGSVSIPIRKSVQYLLPSYGVVTLDFQHVNVTGLDHWSNLTLIQPEAHHFAKFEIATDKGVNVSLRVDLKVDPVDMAQGESLEEVFFINAHLSSADVASHAFVALDRQHWKEFTVDTFIDVGGNKDKKVHAEDEDSSAVTKNPFIPKFRNLGCLLASVLTTNVSDIRAVLNVAEVEVVPSDLNATETPTMQDAEPLHILELELDELMNHIVELVLDQYGIFVSLGLNGFINGPGKDFVNDLLDKYLHSDTDCTWSPPKQSPFEIARRFFEFDVSPAIALVDSVINSGHALKSANHFLKCVSNYIRHVAVPHDDALLEREGLRVKIRELGMDNMDSLYTMNAIKSEIDSYHLMNRMGMGMCHDDNATSSDDPNCRKLLTGLSMDVELEQMNVQSTVDVSLALGNLEAAGGVAMWYDLDILSAVQLVPLAARPQCIASPSPNMELYGLNASLGLLELDVNVTLNKDKKYTLSLGRNDSIAETASSLMADGLSQLQEYLNTFLSRSLVKSPSVCAGVEWSPKRSIHRSAGGIGALLVIVFVGLGVLSLFVWERNKEEDVQVKEERKAGDSATTPLLMAEQSEQEVDSSMQEPVSEPEAQPLPDTPEVGEIRDFDEKVSPKNIFSHPSISRWMAYAVPAILVFTIIDFISSNLSTGARVDLVITGVDGHSLTFPSVYSCSLAKTVKQMYEAGAYILMLLVAVFSGIWPYVKLILMLFSWVTPERFLPLKKRENLLIWLDALGKFSLVDTFILVLMLVAFRYHLEVPGIGDLDVFVKPLYGFFTFLLGTVLSLFMGHVVLFLHRHSMISVSLPDDGPREAVCNHVFVDRRDKQTVRLTTFFKRFLFGSLVFTTIFMGIGVNVKGVIIRFKGLGGYVIGERSREAFSMMSLGSSLPHSVEDTHEFGIRYVQAAYYFFALIMPFVNLVVVCLLFCLPLRIKAQRILFMVAEIANAWSAIEVFVISIVASLLELSRFAAFLVGHRCDFINDILQETMETELEGDAKCFDVSSEMSPATWFLFVGVGMSSLVVFVLLRMAHQAMEERLEQEGLLQLPRRRRRQEEDESVTLVERLARCRVRHYLFHRDDVETPNVTLPLGEDAPPPEDFYDSAQEVWGYGPRAPIQLEETGLLSLSLSGDGKSKGNGGALMQEAEEEEEEATRQEEG